ncbi:MAG: hypothetical protein LAN71_17535 [Acidobacteriia bacterium]|nr:hypothetical protein [Terriglobia bacterium]
MSRKLLLHCLGLMLAWMAGATLAWAQPGGSSGSFKEQFQEVKKSQLGPALGVDQHTVDKLLQIDQRYHPMRHQLVNESKAEFRRLQQVMEQPQPPEQEVKTILTSIKQKQREVERLKQRQDEEEMAILSPVQYARYVFYLQSTRQSPAHDSVKSPGDSGLPPQPVGRGAAARAPQEGGRALARLSKSHLESPLYLVAKIILRALKKA